MTEQTCGCGRPIPDTAYRCTACANHLKRKLDDVAKIAGDITLTVARLDRVSRTGGRGDDLGWWRRSDYIDPRRPATNLAVRGATSRSAMAPVPTPPRLGAAERHDAAVNEIGTWARLVAEERGLQIEPVRFWRLGCLHGRCARVHAGHEAGVTCPLVLADHPLRTALAFLAGSVEWLRHQRFAEEAWPKLEAACADLERVLDTWTATELVGLCACGTGRYSTDQACTRCGETDLQYDREALEAAKEDYRVTASEAARWIASMGLVRDPGKLRHLIIVWAERGHLTRDGGGCYRYGDVLNRVLASPALLRA